MKTFSLLLLFLVLTTFSLAQKEENTLPVELVYFNVSLDSNKVYLNWGTATETNNYGYDIERAGANLQFCYVDFVMGNGNSFSPKDYLFIDTTITENGNYYYRLKQIDTDGAIEYSDTLSISVNSITSVINEFLPSFKLSQNYPNPFNPSTSVDFSLPESGHIQFFIYDITGQETQCLLSEYKNAGSYSTLFNMTNLPSGFYFYKLTLSVNGITRYSASKSLLLLK